MRMRTLIWREMMERRSQLVMSFLAICLGIAVVVGVDTVSYFSERAVERELDTLGANVLILPKAATLQDYYSADLNGETLPEEFVSLLTFSKIQGVDNLSPKLCLPIQMSGRDFILTGILPKNEFRAKAAWGGAGIFSRPIGCGAIDGLPTHSPDPDKSSLARKRVIETLEPTEMLIGSDVAGILDLSAGKTISVLGKSFSIIAVLPETGTVDDSRLFGHLHTIQDLGKTGAVVSAIEVVGCCKEISAGLVDNIRELLPNSKVVTVTQLAKTQMTVNRTLQQLSMVLIGIVVVLGGASIANYMYGNVAERRKEIGTLVALGATPRTIQILFLSKALVLGLVGGTLGYVAGTLIAVQIGPRFAGVPVLPLPYLLAASIGGAVTVTLLASFLPAQRAARLDPCIAFMEA